MYFRSNIQSVAKVIRKLNSPLAAGKSSVLSDDVSGQNVTAQIATSTTESRTEIFRK